MVIGCACYQPAAFYSVFREVFPWHNQGWYALFLFGTKSFFWTLEVSKFQTLADREVLPPLWREVSVEFAMRKGAKAAPPAGQFFIGPERILD